MIVRSLDDYRCQLAQAVVTCTALKPKGREVGLVLFESCGHIFG